MPGRARCSATPSTFQNAVAPATRPASIALTASKPIVVVAHLRRVAAGALRRSSAAPRRRTAARSRRPARPPGRAACRIARLRQHGGQRALHDRHHADEVARRCSRASPRSWMSRIAKSAAAGLQQLQRVGGGAGLADRRGRRPRPRRSRARWPGRCPAWTAFGREVEQQRRVRARAVLPVARAAAGEQRGEEQRGRGAAADARGRRRLAAAWTSRADAPPGHLLAQRHAVAVADVRARTASTARSRRTSRICTTPDEVERLLDGAARRSVKELLVLTGDDPAHHPGVRERLAELGLRRTSSPTSCGAASGRWSAGCCRTRTSARCRAPTSPACARSPQRRG